MTDIADEELKKLRARIGAALKKFGSLPEYALQYRICEVGQVRPDPRALRRALAELANNKRPRWGRLDGGIAQDETGLFFDQRETRANRRNSELHGVVRQLEEYGSKNVMEIMASNLRELAREVRISASRPGKIRHLGYGCAFQSVTAILDGRAKEGWQFSLLLSHDLEWLYPDDPLLWSFLRRARASQRTPLIIGRKISPATFTILKIVGALARQYFAMVVDPSAPAAIVKNTAELGWLRTERADSTLLALLSEQFIALTASPPSLPDKADEAILAAERLKLMREEGPRRAMERWADAIQIEMPSVWLNTVRRWPTYSRYKRRSPEKPFRSAEKWAPTIPRLSQIDDAAQESSTEKPATPFGRIGERSRVPTVIR